MSPSASWRRASDDLTTTQINHYEVTLGILREGTRALQAELREAWSDVLGAVEILPFSRLAADTAAARQAELGAKGRVAGLSDLLIASIAKAEGCEAIVTRNVEDFERIGLVDVRRH